MSVKTVILLTMFLVYVFCTEAQKTCSTLGQNPSTAFPVCGTDVFSQLTVPYCGGKTVPGPCQVENYVTDTNPFWYKFTCFKSGTLGFLIRPDDLSDDYDWQLFDITGHSPTEVYTNRNLVVACNWSGNPGNTGSSAGAASLFNCLGKTYPTFSSMPTLQLGHNYLLLVSHFTKFRPSQKGYKLSFGGGSAVITDVISPHLQSINSSCAETKLYIKLNKKMQCSSLAKDGSDFVISPSVVKINAAISICDAFDMDSIVLGLSAPLPVGDYTISVKSGTDGNTLLDNCGTYMRPGNYLSLSVLPKIPTPMDSLTPFECAPQSLQLFFKKNILCNSVAADGSDFIVTGPSAVKVMSANCGGAESKTITVNLFAPIVVGGAYQIKLKRGNDGNTILDECTEETPAGSFIDFSIKDTVAADFTYKEDLGCVLDTVHFQNEVKNGINQWFWQFDNNATSTLQNPVSYFSTFGNKQITLTVSNGFCSDTISKQIVLDNELKASFETSNLLCPEDSAVFKNESVGKINSYYWNFQNGNTSMEKDPFPEKYPILLAERNYSVMLVIENDLGCFDTALNNIRVLKSCYIAVPSAFTPNGDGLNDVLYPVNAYKADNLEFKVYNRFGQLVFETKDWTQKWDGSIKGDPQDAGVYVWTLKYVLHDTGKAIFMKGSTVLIR